MALEDTLEFGQRPKIDPYGDHMLLVFFTARATGDPEWPAEPLEIHIYLSGGYIVTVRRDAVRAARRPARAARPTSRPHDEEILVYRVLDTLTDAYYPVIDAVETEIDALEGEVLAPPAARAAAPQLPAQAVRARAAPARRPPSATSSDRRTRRSSGSKG